MEINEEATDYMDEDLALLMLREEGTYWEPLAIVEATIELESWAWEGVAHPIEDSVKKIKTVKSVTFAKMIKTVELVAPAKNIVSVPIEFISGSISIPVNSVCDSILVESDLVKSIESVKNSFPYNMIVNSAYFVGFECFYF